MLFLTAMQILVDADACPVKKIIVRLARQKNIPVIMLTAKSQDEDILKGYKEQVSSYITKPFNLDELVNTINMILESKK